MVEDESEESNVNNDIEDECADMQDLFCRGCSVAKSQGVEVGYHRVSNAVTVRLRSQAA